MEEYSSIVVEAQTEKVWQDAMMEEYPSSSKQAHAKQICLESAIDSMNAVDLSTEEYQDRFVVKGLSEKVSVDLVEDFALITVVFKLHGRNTHHHRLKNVHYEMINAARTWYFRINQLLPMLGSSKICGDLSLIS